MHFIYYWVNEVIDRTNKHIRQFINPAMANEKVLEPPPATQKFGNHCSTKTLWITLLIYNDIQHYGTVILFKIVLTHFIHSMAIT